MATRTSKSIPGGAPGKFPGTPPVLSSRRREPRPVQGYAGHVRVRDPKGRFVQGGSGVAMYGIEAMAERINAAAASMKATTKTGADRVAQAMEQYAKDNAPWTDRTGNARSTMTGVAVAGTDGNVTIYLGYRVFYGIYLEYANGGEYAIVGPTMLVFAPQIMGRIRNTISFNANAGVHVPVRGFTP